MHAFDVIAKVISCALVNPHLDFKCFHTINVAWIDSLTKFMAPEHVRMIQCAMRNIERRGMKLIVDRSINDNILEYLNLEYEHITQPKLEWWSIFDEGFYAKPLSPQRLLAGNIEIR